MPAFMSNVPGPVQAVAVAAERHALERADRPHGVEVAEEHDRLVPPPAKRATDVIAALRLRQHVDRRAGRAQHLRQDASRSDRPPPCRCSATRAAPASRSSGRCRRDALRSSAAGSFMWPLSRRATFTAVRRPSGRASILWRMLPGRRASRCWPRRRSRSRRPGTTATKPPAPARRAAPAADAAQGAAAQPARAGTRPTSRTKPRSACPSIPARSSSLRSMPAGASATTCSAPMRFLEIVNYYKTIAETEG